MISIIIPVYNEEKVLTKNSAQLKNLSQEAELIFVDGGSTDKSIQIAQSFGKVIQSKKGRAAQMNCGAKAAEGEVLLFLHADNIIFPETLTSMESHIKNNGFIGGCLTQRIDKNGIIYRVIEGQGNLRARLSKVFYGDQGIFVKKGVFFKIGGFPEVPIMEDMLFTKKLRMAGKTVVLPEKIFVSPRRWKKGGIIKTSLFYSLIAVLFRLGYPLEKIKLLYDDLR